MSERTDNKEYTLIEIEYNDIENIHKGLSNHNVTKHYDVHFSTIEETKEQMLWYETIKKEHTGIWWGIYNKDNQFCGAGGFNDLNKVNRKAEIGFWLLEEFWGQGILKEVMPKLFREGFDKLNLNRIEGYVDSNNQKCKTALQKINFTYEGTMREVEIKNEKKISIDIYAILKGEWNRGSY